MNTSFNVRGLLYVMQSCNIITDESAIKTFKIFLRRNFLIIMFTRKLTSELSTWKSSGGVINLLLPLKLTSTVENNYLLSFVTWSACSWIHQFWNFQSNVINLIKNVHLSGLLLSTAVARGKCNEAILTVISSNIKFRGEISSFHFIWKFKLIKSEWGNHLRISWGCVLIRI